MTCIVAVTHDGRVTMGGDSFAGGADYWYAVATPKIFTVGDFLIGSCGSFRIADAARYSFSPPSPRRGETPDHYMRTRFLRAFNKCLDDAGVAAMDATLLIGFQGHIFHLQPDKSVLSPPDWGVAIGAGEGPAMGSLWTTREARQPETRVRTALEAAQAVSMQVREPFHVEVL